VGARPVLLVTTAAQGAFWLTAPNLGFEALVGLGFVAGVLGVPIFGLMRQYVAAMVPAEQHRTAFALDSMAVEVSYMLGPALAVAAVTTLGSDVAMMAVAVGMVGAGTALIVLNRPTVSAEEQGAAAVAVQRRQWLTPGMVMVLAVTAAVTFVLSATELSVVAVLGERDATAWTGVVIGVWCAYSLVGGFVFGAVRQTPSTLLLVGGLAAFTVPLALVGGGWWWLLVALVPAGLLCAPSLASTVDTVSGLVPPRARGEAMGLHGSALTVGIATGAPAAGAVIDSVGPGWGFVLAGGVGVLVVLAAVPLWPRRRPATAPAPAAVLATV
jgi:predicted MFS family arabinose efflux permease